MYVLSYICLNLGCLYTLALAIHQEIEKYIFSLISEIQNLRLPTFTIDSENQHTNIIHVKISDKSNITSRKVIERLAIVSQSEGNCKTADGTGIIVLGSAKPDPKTVKFVLHHDVNDDDLRLAVNKIKFVLTEIDRNK